MRLKVPRYSNTGTYRSKTYFQTLKVSEKASKKFVLTIIFPIFVLAAPRDGSSPDLMGLPDLPSFDVKGRAADISIFMDDIDDIEVEEDDNSRGDVIVEPNNSGLIGQDPNAPRVSLSGC